MNIVVSNRNDDILSSLQIDIIKKLNGEFSIDELVSTFDGMLYEKLIIDITSINGYEDAKNLQNLSIHFNLNQIILLLEDSTSSEYISKLISMGIYNFTKNKEGILKLAERSNTYKDVAGLHEIEDKVTIMTRADNSKTKVLGIQNLTEHAGSTTMIYMLKNELKENYTVRAIEIDKRDFVYFNDKEMISTTKEDLGSELLKLNGNVDIVLIDLNNSGQENACNDAIYLIEPSIIKLNKLMAKNKELLEFARDKKVVLNKSLLPQKDIIEFEMESGVKIFYSIPPLNDRIPSTSLDGLLVKLGFLKQNTEETESAKESKIFGIFRRRS